MSAVAPIVSALALASSEPHDVRVDALSARSDLSTAAPPHAKPFLCYVRTDAEAGVCAAASSVLRGCYVDDTLSATGRAGRRHPTCTPRISGRLYHTPRLSPA